MSRIMGLFSSITEMIFRDLNPLLISLRHVNKKEDTAHTNMIAEEQRIHIFGLIYSQMICIILKKNKKKQT